MFRSRQRLATLALRLVLASLTLGAGSGHAQEIRVGTEFLVNTYIQQNQDQPAVALDADGDFVVAWSSSSFQDGQNRGVFAQRFSRNGTRVGAEFQVNQFTSYNQQEPAVALDGAGNFVIAWESAGQDAPGAGYGVFARRFSSSGAGLGSEFMVNTITSGFQNSISVAASPAGDFAVVWMGDNGVGNYQDIFVQLYSDDGSKIGGEFVINTYTLYKQRLPSVAASGTGDFVVVWSSYRQDGNLYGVFGRRFSSAGTAIGADFQVNTYTNQSQDLPAVAADADGDFVVAWTSTGAQDGSDYGVFAQRFSSAGSPVAAEFQVNAYTMGFQGLAGVATKGNGEFIVSWGDYDVYARRFSSAGAALTGDLLVNGFTPSVQSFPVIASSAGGRFVVAWSSKYQDGSENGVFAQRFAIPIPLDVDGDGAADPLTDGILALRYMFGFRGETLITGAVNDDGCTRCDAPAIETHLAAIAE